MPILGLKPFLSFYGSKWRIAPKYPPPVFKTIVEPFAGGAGYSCRYPDREVVLCEIDPVIYGVWDYLISVSESELRSLPVDFPCVDVLTNIPQEARWFIGFWMSQGCAHPCSYKSPFSLQPGNRTWDAANRECIATQLQYIRHWKVVNSSWHHVEQYVTSKKATWFVDPPYSGSAGRAYRFNYMNYRALARWVKGLDGQVIVCEEKGADWLPFEDFMENQSGKGRGRRKSGMEMIWTNTPVEGRKKQLPCGQKKRKRLHGGCS